MGWSEDSAYLQKRGWVLVHSYELSKNRRIEERGEWKRTEMLQFNDLGLTVLIPFLVFAMESCFVPLTDEELTGYARR